MGAGGVGWVKVIYNVPDAPELPVEDGFVVVRVPLGGKIVTRSRMNPSWNDSEFYYQSPDGKRERLSSKDDDNRRLWGMEKTFDNQRDTRNDQEVFFVGKQEDFTRLFKASGDMGTGLLEQKPPNPAKEADLPK